MDLEKLVIKVMAETTDAQTKLNKIRDAANKTAQSANKGLGSIGKNSDGGLRKTLNQIKSINNAIKGFGRKIQLGTGMIKPTQGFKDLTVKIIDADTALEEFRQKLAAMDESDPNFSELAASVKEAEDVIEGMNEALNEAVADGSAFEDGWIGKVKSGLGKITSGAKSLISHFPRIGGAARAARGGVDSLFKGLRGIWTIAKTIAIGAGITGWMNATKQGFSNLAAYSASTRGSIDMLKSSLLTLKNAFATALAPLLDIVAPVLSAVIDWFTAAATAVAQLFSALTGKSVAVVARKATSGIDGVGSSASNAADSVDELKRSIMGFDQINKLDDNSSSGGGGGGGGGGAGGAGSMFDTVEIDSGIKSLAEEIKEAWETADFTELGARLAQKLNEALESIPWDKIQATARKIAKSIATFLNGFFGEEQLWTTVGNTFAQALNTVIEFGYTFVNEFSWTKFGKAISNAIDGFFDKIDTAKAARTLSGAIKGVLDTAITLLNETDWQKVGTKVGEFLVNIDWIGVAKKVGQAIVAAFKAVGAVFEGIGLAILQAIQDYLKNKLGIEIDLVGKLTKLDPDPKLNRNVDTTANLTDKKDNLSDKTIGGMTAEMRYKKKSSKFNNKITGMTAEMRYKKKAARFNNNISGMTATVTKVSFSAKAKHDLKTHLSGSGHAVMAGGGVYMNGTWKPVTAAAGGGLYNQGQMFVAREAGPELVGTIGGNTAVMNNDQIVSSVSAGVYKAVLSAMSQNKNGGGVIITLEGDAGKLFRVMRTEAQNYTRSTGLSAFPV